MMKIAIANDHVPFELLESKNRSKRINRLRNIAINSTEGSPERVSSQFPPIPDYDTETNRNRPQSNGSDTEISTKLPSFELSENYKTPIRRPVKNKRESFTFPAAIAAQRTNQRQHASHASRSRTFRNLSTPVTSGIKMTPEEFTLLSTTYISVVEAFISQWDENTENHEKIDQKLNEKGFNDYIIPVEAPDLLKIVSPQEKVLRIVQGEVARQIKTLSKDLSRLFALAIEHQRVILQLYTRFIENQRQNDGLFQRVVDKLVQLNTSQINEHEMMERKGLHAQAGITSGLFRDAEDSEDNQRQAILLADATHLKEILLQAPGAQPHINVLTSLEKLLSRVLDKINALSQENREVNELARNAEQDIRSLQSRISDNSDFVNIAYEQHSREIASEKLKTQQAEEQLRKTQKIKDQLSIKLKDLQAQMEVLRQTSHEVMKFVERQKKIDRERMDNRRDAAVQVDRPPKLSLPSKDMGAFSKLTARSPLSTPGGAPPTYRDKKYFEPKNTKVSIPSSPLPSGASTGRITEKKTKEDKDKGAKKKSKKKTSINPIDWPRASGGKAQPINWLYALISSIYSAKMKHDTAASKFGFTNNDIVPFIHHYLLTIFGCRKMVEQYLCDIVQSVRTHNDSLRVKLFGILTGIIEPPSHGPGGKKRMDVLSPPTGLTPNSPQTATTADSGSGTSNLSGSAFTSASRSYGPVVCDIFLRCLAELRNNKTPLLPHDPNTQIMVPIEEVKQVCTKLFSNWPQGFSARVLTHSQSVSKLSSVDAQQIDLDQLCWVLIGECQLELDSIQAGLTQMFEALDPTKQGGLGYDAFQDFLSVVSSQLTPEDLAIQSVALYTHFLSDLAKEFWI